MRRNGSIKLTYHVLVSKVGKKLLIELNNCEVFMEFFIIVFLINR